MELRTGTGVAHPAFVLRSTLVLGALLSLVACAPAQKESSAAGTTDPSGFLAFTTHADGMAEHWSTDVVLRGAPAGTYALVVGAAGRPSVADFAVQCARAGGKSCALPAGGALVALADVGPGGSGVLRAAFTKGDGASFSVVRLAGSASGSANVAVRVLSEAMAAGEKPQRFAIAMSPSLPPTGGGSS